jgi:molybdate transport system substrate-binding protein
MTGVRRSRALRLGLGFAAMTLLAWAAPVTAIEPGRESSPATALRAQTTTSAAEPIRVLSAASLTEVVEALARDFASERQGARVELGFGASSDLARQIRDGAPVDVFVSASPEWTDFLREAGVVVGEPVLIARNALVCIAPQDGRLTATVVADPRVLVAKIAADELVAIADAGVPAGEYARQALAKLGLAAVFEPRLVGQKDVRAVLHAVEQGEVAAGFVYATDAKVARVATLFAFDPTTHPPIEYHAVVVRNADRPSAADAASHFVDFLTSGSARARLSAAGFVLP